MEILVEYYSTQYVSLFLFFKTCICSNHTKEDMIEKLLEACLHKAFMLVTSNSMGEFQLLSEKKPDSKGCVIPFI